MKETRSLLQGQKFLSTGKKRSFHLHRYLCLSRLLCSQVITQIDQGLHWEQGVDEVQHSALLLLGYVLKFLPNRRRLSIQSHRFPARALSLQFAPAKELRSYMYQAQKFLPT